MAGGGGASTLGGGTAGLVVVVLVILMSSDGRANSDISGISATPHTGSGGGAGSSTGFGNNTRSGGGNGGSGIVVIKIPSYPLNLGENRLALSNSSLTYDISYVDNAGSYTSSPQIDGETIYIFKQGSGTITPNFSYDCSYLVVAGGGGGGTSQIEDRGAGGGGAGGLKFGVISVVNNVAYTVQVGAGGVGGEYQVKNGTTAGNGAKRIKILYYTILLVKGEIWSRCFWNPRLVEMEVQVEEVGTVVVVVLVFLVKVILEVVLVSLVVEEVDMLEVGIQEAIQMEGQVEMDTQTLLQVFQLHMQLEEEEEDMDQVDQVDHHKVEEPVLMDTVHQQLSIII